MQLKTKFADPAKRDFYIVLPDERRRVKALLAPLPVKDLERAYKQIVHNVHMCEPLKFSALDRVRFCAFKNALALARMAAPHDLRPTPQEKKMCERHMERAKNILTDYEGAFARLIAPLTVAQLDKLRTRNQNNNNTFLGLDAALVMIECDTLALHEIRLKRLTPEAEQEVRIEAEKYKAKIVKKIAPNAGLLTSLKPW